MEYFRPSVKVGAFILVALGLLIFAAIMVGELGNWFAIKKSYTVVFKDASLLPEGARVSYAGYAVGTVGTIRVRSDAERAREFPEYPVALTIAVRADVPVRDDSPIEMKTNGMIGDRYVDILPGTGKLVAAGSTLPGNAGGLDGLFASLSGADGGIQDLLPAMKALLMDTSRPDSLPSTLASVNRLLSELQPVLIRLASTGDDLLQQAQQELVSTSDKAGRVLQGIDVTIAENRPGIRRLIGELNTTLVEAQRTIDTTRTFLDVSKGELTTLMQSARSLIEGIQENRKVLSTRAQKLLTDLDEMIVQNDRNIYATIENLRDMTAHLEATAELVRANPAVILFGRRNRDGDDLVPTSSQSDHFLQDRGRIGRYDRGR
jgi:phospholipid/cholesterol/gamma-HCH transport system substrate-binding protein